MPVVDESALIARAQGGDPGATDELVKLWGPRVRRFASRLCPVTEALDAAQESLFVLSSRVTSLKSAQAVVSWTFQIVKRQCQKVFSRMRRDTNLARELGIFHPASSTLTHDRALWLQELMSVLNQLPRTYRQALWLKDLEERSAAEAAVIAGLSEAAFKSRLHRARVVLRERLLASPASRTLPDW